VITEALVAVKHLKKYFPIKSGAFGGTTNYIRAVDDVSFNIIKGETLGLVGESGCGKTTLGRCMLRLTEPTDGEIIYKNMNILKLSKNEFRKIRADFQIIFQNPKTSLDPRMNVKNIIAEPLVFHKKVQKSGVNEKIIELLNLVGLREEHMWRYPDELSGGQCQRVAIARAISINPQFLVLDEPTSSLDVSVQAQIINLLREVQNKLKLSYLFISHNLLLVNYISDRIGVMYLGELVEFGPADEVFKEPLHPYSVALTASAPIPDPESKIKRIPLIGEIPPITRPPSGCRFHPRCKHAMDRCKKEEPKLVEKSGRLVACYLYE
jgi:oligopeptide/dipeptide ABC transporter ATP-binding protein